MINCGAQEASSPALLPCANRPLFVSHELPLAPGSHALEVAFVRLGGPAVTPESEHDDEAHAEHDDDAHGRERDHRQAARLELRAAVAPTAGEVALITYDPDFGTLLARAPAPQARP